MKNAIKNRRSSIYYAIAFLAALLIAPPPTVLNAQGGEQMPYNPCQTEIGMPSVCVTGFKTCVYYAQYPCSGGYCWDGGNIPPNQGIPTNGVVADKTIDIGGDYKITQSVTFINCKFKMRGGSSITIEPSNANSVQIAFENCDFFGCNQMWRGININAAGVPDFQFSFTDCTVEDAYIGLILDEGLNCHYIIADNLFVNNHIGISNRQNGYGKVVNAVLVRNNFNSGGALSAVPSSMQNLPMPNYPLAHAGIKYANIRATIGVLPTGATGNTMNRVDAH